MRAVGGEAHVLRGQATPARLSGSVTHMYLGHCVQSDAVTSPFLSTGLGAGHVCSGPSSATCLLCGSEPVSAFSELRVLQRLAQMA